MAESNSVDNSTFLENDTVEANGDLEGSSHERDPLLSKQSRIQTSIVIKEIRSYGINNIEAMLHLIKGNIGTGMLAMPSAVMNAGLWTGFFGIGLIGFAAVHCMHLLVKAARKMSEKYHDERMGYDDCAEKVVYDFYQSERLAKYAKLTVNIFLCITQFGFCTVYILFIATNMQQFIEHFTGEKRSLRLYQTLVTVFLIPFCWIKSLKVLAPFSMMANILLCIGLVVIFQYCFTNLPPYWEYPEFAEIKRLPLFFGIVVFAFEGISLVLPIENKMKQPCDFPGLTGVLNTGMVIVTVLYMAVGFYGYIKFGDAIKGSITLNMPSDHWLYLTLKVVFSMVIFVSYGVQFYVPAMILIPSIQQKLNFSSRPLLVNGVIRSMFVVGTLVMSLIVPHLDLMISLIGALASSSLALIFPPIIDILLCWPQNLGKYKWMLWKNIFIIAFGVFGFFTGTIATLIQIVNAFS